MATPSVGEETPTTMDTFSVHNARNQRQTQRLLVPSGHICRHLPTVGTPANPRTEIEPNPQIVSLPQTPNLCKTPRTQLRRTFQYSQPPWSRRDHASTASNAGSKDEGGPHSWRPRLPPSIANVRYHYPRTSMRKRANGEIQLSETRYIKNST
ncbi:hypothetical protein QAD02_004923 [Eretmocerus hayati]|uniref:Uncharacterized protein n=1 Tax=Eretmocerus hayati TaxID=131215 RepID=A0ACC2NSU0_9HYME|nr:hypothetical protein QAD02_004923 [Eretmocerus hayati]